MMWAFAGLSFALGVMVGIAYSATQIAPMLNRYRSEFNETFAENITEIIRAKDSEIARLEKIIRDNV